MTLQNDKIGSSTHTENVITDQILPASHQRLHNKGVKSNTCLHHAVQGSLNLLQVTISQKKHKRLQSISAGKS